MCKMRKIDMIEMIEMGDSRTDKDGQVKEPPAENKKKVEPTPFFQPDAKRQQKSLKQKSSWEAQYRGHHEVEEQVALESMPKVHKVKEIVQKRPQVTIPKFITVANLAYMFKLRLSDLQRRMRRLGFEETQHDFLLDSETASLIADELGFEVVINDKEDIDIFPAPISQDLSTVQLRPPIVTIMGHVDHGKTTILDYLRKSSIAAGEHGGITQHIGAFSVKLPNSDKKICFLDTPGHAAFLNMRQRGANVTDIVILVIAADDSVMPQTKEAIKHAKAAGVPMIVAVNKIDRPDADPEKVIGDLAANEVDVEPYGGDTQVIPVSGLKGTGIDKLEEAILTLSEVLDLRAPAEGNAEGRIIESEVKKGVGAVATVLVRRGTLKPGSFIVAGNTWCKVRSLTSDLGKIVKSAGPSVPVEVLGWKELPDAGDEVLEATNEDHAKRVVENRIEREKQIREAKDIDVINEKRRQLHVEQEIQKRRRERVRLGLPSEEEEKSQKSSDGEEKSELKFIVKADVSGSAEAVVDSIVGLGNNLVSASVLYSGVGSVTESDVTRAETANASILAFNLRFSKEAASLAARRHVEIINHAIIYRLLEDVTARLTALLKPEIKHKVLGEALVKEVFEISLKKSKKVVIAGCRVSNGQLTRNALVKVLRNKEIVYIGKFSSMQHHKDEVSEAKKDSECGLSFDDWDKFQSGDVIQTYEEIKIQRHL